MVFENAIESIRVESEYGPTLDFDPNSPPSQAMLTLRPKYTVKLRGTSVPLSYAPYGEPGPTKWPYVEAVAAVGGLAILALAFGFLRFR